MLYYWGGIMSLIGNTADRIYMYDNLHLHNKHCLCTIYGVCTCIKVSFEVSRMPKEFNSNFNHRIIIVLKIYLYQSKISPYISPIFCPDCQADNGTEFSHHNHNWLF